MVSKARASSGREASESRTLLWSDEATLTHATRRQGGNTRALGTIANRPRNQYDNMGKGAGNE